MRKRNSVGVEDRGQILNCVMQQHLLCDSAFRLGSGKECSILIVRVADQGPDVPRCARSDRIEGYRCKKATVNDGTIRELIRKVGFCVALGFQNLLNRRVQETSLAPELIDEESCK